MVGEVGFEPTQPEATDFGAKDKICTYNLLYDIPLFYFLNYLDTVRPDSPTSALSYVIFGRGGRD